MTREEQVMNEAEAQKVFGPDAYVGFLNGVKWADEHPESPWISVRRGNPANKGGIYNSVRGLSTRCLL